MKNWKLGLGCLGLGILVFGCAMPATAAPAPTTITPGTAINGQILLATVEGTGFVAGSGDTRVTFEVGGILDARTGLSNISAEVLSATALQIYINVPSGAFVGDARALTVTNPDGTSGKAIGVFSVSSNPGTTKIGTPVFSTSSGFVEYNGSSSSSMTIDPSSLYVSVKISSEAGMSQAKSNPKILIDNIIFADNLQNKFTPSSDATSGFLGFSGPYNSGTTGEVVITIYAESDSGVPETFPCFVNIPLPTPTPQPSGTTNPAVATPNTDPKPGNPVAFQIHTEGTVQQIVNFSIFGSSACYVRTNIPARPMASASTPGSNYYEVDWDGTSDIGGGAGILEKSGVHLARIITQENVGGTIVNRTYVSKFTVYRKP